MSTTTCLLYRRQVVLCDKGEGEASDNNMPLQTRRSAGIWVMSKGVMTTA